MTNACLECCRTVGIRKSGYCKNHHAVCIDCGARINEKSKRCRPCLHTYMRANRVTPVPVLYHCSDCGKVIRKQKSERCRSCATKLQFRLSQDTRKEVETLITHYTEGAERNLFGLGNYFKQRADALREKLNDSLTIVKLHRELP